MAISPITVFLLVSSIGNVLSSIETNVGLFNGLTVMKNGFLVNQYLGIPYAQPPVGERRFKRPAPVTTDKKNVVFATHFKPTCVQHPHMQEVISPLLDVDHHHQVRNQLLNKFIYFYSTSSNFSFFLISF